MYALDLTPDFDELLKKHGGGPTKRPTFDAALTTSFLQEAYRINGHIATLAQQLGNVRPAYLSTAPPRRRASHRRDAGARARAGSIAGDTTTALTDAEREEIDGNAKRLLRDLNASIRGLADAEALHQETQQALVKRRFGTGGAAGVLRLGGFSLVPALALGKSAEQTTAEEALRQAAAHRESVLWYLRQRLQACGQIQQTMMEARVARMVEGATGAVGSTGSTGPTGTNPTAAGSATGTTTMTLTTSGNPPRSGHDAALQENNANGVADVAEAGLTQEQVQLFEHDNQDMMRYYETTLDKVRAAEQSLVEIAELQTMLVGNLELQSAHVDQMLADSVNTAQNVARGNQELKKALNRPSAARYTFYAASGLCLFVVVWDFFV